MKRKFEQEYQIKTTTFVFTVNISRHVVYLNINIYIYNSNLLFYDCYCVFYCTNHNSVRIKK